MSKICKIMAAAAVAIAAVCWAPQATNAAPALYDDFSAALIDRTKWANLEFVRRVENGVLKSELRRFGFKGTNTLIYAGLDTVSSFQAEVTVAAVSTTAARASVRLFSHFYNDGTPGGGEIGQIFANIEIRDSGIGLHVVFYVGRCSILDCSSATVLISDNTTFGPVNLGETHILSLEWDGAQFFTFGFDGTSVQLDPTAMAPVAGPSKVARTVIRTQIDRIDGPEEGGAISVTYDNVRVNGLPYDDFSTALIDRTKWAKNLEFVRQIESGAFKSEFTRFGSTGNNNFNFADTAAVNAYQADVTVTQVSTTGASVNARLAGYFYNTGAAGGGETGEVFAGIQIRDSGNGLKVTNNVFLCGDPSCSTGTTLIFDDTTFGPVNLNETHTLSLAWDGRRFFTFGFDGNTVKFDAAAAPVAIPSKFSFKGFSLRVFGTGGDPDRGAHIAATFDNVKLADPAFEFPLDVTCEGKPCTPYTAKISSVMDHSGTPLDSNNPSDWYSKNSIVEAYTREKGEKRFGSNSPPSGYLKDAKGTPFIVNGNYTGVLFEPGPCKDGKGNAVPCFANESYLNYDGHSGYDYPYPVDTPIIAPARGRLFKAAKDTVNHNSSCAFDGWEEWHTFYIVHGNGFTTWYLHASDLHSKIKNEIDSNGSAMVAQNQVVAFVGGFRAPACGTDLGPHLHFEVRKGLNQVVDPYSEGLWKAKPPTKAMPWLKLLLLDD